MSDSTPNPIFRLLVCGSRTVTDRAAVFARLDAWLDASGVDATRIVVVDGMARGVDTYAYEWAATHRLASDRFPADWKRYGRSAGIRRNVEMLDAGVDWVIAFVDKPLESSRGTADMVRRAKEAGVHGIVVRLTPPAPDATPRVWSRRRPGDIPAGAVYVGRPTVWGNPFVEGRDGDRDEVIARYRRNLKGHPELLARVRNELAGQHLVCWCAPHPCHADVLMELANQPQV